MIHGAGPMSPDCEGCGDVLEVSGSYAGDDGFDPIEIVELRCRGCGGEVETTAPLLVLVDDAGGRAA